MDYPEINIELFDNYLDNKLSQGERDAFENRLKTEKLFATDFQQHKIIRKAIRINSKEKLKQFFSNIEKEISKDKLKQYRPPSNNGRRLLWGIIGIISIIALLLLGYLYLNKPEQLKSPAESKNASVNDSIHSEGNTIESSSFDSIIDTNKVLKSKKVEGVFLNNTENINDDIQLDEVISDSSLTNSVIKQDKKSLDKKAEVEIIEIPDTIKKG